MDDQSQSETDLGAAKDALGDAVEWAVRMFDSDKSTTQEKVTAIMRASCQMMAYQMIKQAISEREQLRDFEEIFGK